MKKNLVLICLAAATLLNAENLIENTVTSKAFGWGDLLLIELETGGDIVIEGRETSRISVRYEVKRGDRELIEVSFQETDRGLSLHGHLRVPQKKFSCSLVLTIQVPRQLDIELMTSGGSVSMSHLEGVFRGKTLGGTITLTQMNGEVDLQTNGGDIHISNSDLDGKVSTLGGQVHFVDVIGNVRGQTNAGSVTHGKSQRDGGGDSMTDPIHITTLGGDIEIDDAPFGAKVQTQGGNIVIYRANDFVEAKTNGGNVSIHELDGQARVVTFGGDVSLKMVGDPALGKRNVVLISKSGNINLSVPEGLSMDIEIELAFTRGSSKNYRIHSDVPLEIETDKEWDYSLGDPRKVMHGRGLTGGGRHTIRISTVNGSVTLSENQP